MLATYRDEIRQVLEDRDLQFSYSHHRALWRQIQQLLAQADAAAPFPEH
jgi:DNA primase